MWVDKRWGPINPDEWWGSGTSVYSCRRTRDATGIEAFGERLLENVGGHYDWMRAVSQQVLAASGLSRWRREREPFPSLELPVGGCFKSSEPARAASEESPGPADRICALPKALGAHRGRSLHVDHGLLSFLYLASETDTKAATETTAGKVESKALPASAA